ncbi:MAG: polyprenyl synthetase family protein, partial [Bacteroidales bacterium]|nr:polyprenyl synthetase family protein [Bacteroidales bacterium]
KQEKLEELAEFVREKGGIDYAKQRQISFCEEAKRQCFLFPESDARAALVGLIDFIAFTEQ